VSGSGITWAKIDVYVYVLAYVNCMELKCKTDLDLLEQEIVSGSSISWAICKSAPGPRQITTPASHHSVLTGQMPSCHPTNSTKALKHNQLAV